MKKISYLLIAITLGFLFNLAKEETCRFDILNTKNDHLLQFKKAEVDLMTNIEEVKAFAKKGLEINRENFRRESVKAWNNFYILVGLMIIQLVLVVLIYFQKKEKV
jgi:uncharacterized membrane protein YraQ (UPF0718 family)